MSTSSTFIFLSSLRSFQTPAYGDNAGRATILVYSGPLLFVNVSFVLWISIERNSCKRAYALHIYILFAPSKHIPTTRSQQHDRNHHFDLCISSYRNVQPARKCLLQQLRLKKTSNSGFNSCWSSAQTSWIVQFSVSSEKHARGHQFCRSSTTTRQSESPSVPTG